MIIYSFFKNIALVFILFFFQSDNGWSGSSLYNQWVYSGYNFFVGLLPFYMGFFGLDTTKETVNKNPALYAAGLRGMDLNSNFGCVEINQCVRCTRQFFTKSFLSDGVAALVPSSGEESASPCHRAGVASMAWRTTL